MKKLLSILVLCVSFVALVACDSLTKNTNDGSTTAATPSTVASTEKPATTTKSHEVVEFDLADLAGETIDILFWHTWGASKSAVLDAMVEEYKQMMLDKYEITVNVTSTSQSDYSTIRTKTNQAIASGNKASMPTLVTGYPDHFAEYIKSRAVLSLEDYIYSSTPEVAVDLSEYVAAYVEENNQFKGTMYSMPLSKSAEFMAYNKSITDDLGITVPYDRAMTWTELAAIVESETYNIIGYNKNYADILYLVNYDSTDNMFINFARQLNAKYTTAAGELLVTDNSTIQMISTIEQMIEKKYVSVPYNYSDSASYGSDYFKQQNMVFTIGSTAGYSYNYNGGVQGGESSVLDPENGINYDYEIGFAPVPQFVTDPAGNAASSSVVQQGPNVCILDSGTDEEALMAWMLIKYLTYQDQYDPSNEAANEEGFVEGQNNSARLAISTGYFPVTNTAFESTLYKAYLDLAESFYEANYSYEGFTEKEVAMLQGGYPQIAYVGYIQTSSYRYDPAFPASSTLLGSATIREEAGNLINKIALNTKYDAKTALQELLAACSLNNN